MLQGEVTTVNINQEESMKGIKIQNKIKEIKISQYAGDSYFFLTKKESVENIPKYFEKLKKATIETISLEKTVILSINANQTLYLQQN